MPERQLSLLEPEPRPLRPPAVPVRTSIAAAEAIAEMAPTLRGKVYGYIAECRDRGATRQEIADNMVLDPNQPEKRMLLQTVCARIGELKAQGLVWEGSESREGRRVVRIKRA